MKEVAGESIVRVVISKASPKPGSLGLYFATDSEEPEALTAHTTPPPLSAAACLFQADTHPSVQA